jgi:hypothetical protein
MTTVQDLVNDVRRMVYGTLTEQINLIEIGASAGSNTLKLEMGVDGIQKGMMLSSGLNVWFVKAVSAQDNEVYVIPGYNGAPIDPVEAGDIIYIRPRMTDWYAFNAINDEIRKLSSSSQGLYKVGQWQVLSDPIYQTYDVPVEAQRMTRLVRVRFRWPGTVDLYSDLPTSAWRWMAEDNRVQLLRNIPSGVQVQFVYLSPFTAATSLLDDPVEDCGLAETMLDLPPLGAAVSLLRTTEARRNQVQTQGDARRAGEVSATANSNIAAQLDREYRDRVNDEYVRLTARLPIFKGI